MSVLEAPQTWIAAAAVLVVAAVVLIALAPRRRSGADAAAEGDAGARGEVDEAVTAPVSSATMHGRPRAADGPWAADDEPWADDATTTTTATDAPTTTTATTGAAGPWADDEPVTAVTSDSRGATTAAAARTGRSSATVPLSSAGTDGPPSRVTRRYQPVTDPARSDDRAKDRLLAVLLADPAAAVDVVAAIGEGDAGGASGASAAALLRAGLRPDQVASLCGVDEGDLGELVARDLGLLERPAGSASRPEGPAAAQSGRSRTDEPGRAWASAASAPRSTTPTTG